MSVAPIINPGWLTTRRARVADYPGLERNVVMASAAFLLIGLGVSIAHLCELSQHRS